MKSNKTMSIAEVKSDLCHWLYNYSDGRHCYIDELVNTIHRIFGSGYIRTFHEQPNRFFAIIGEITSKYIGMDIVHAVMLAYEKECEFARFPERHPTLKL